MDREWPKQLRLMKDFLDLPGVIRVTQKLEGANYVTCWVTPDLTDRELARLSGYANRLREVNTIITFERIEL